MQRRKYTEEFKREAVRLASERDVSLAQIAKEIDINENMLRRWRKEYQQQGNSAFPGQDKPRDAEMAAIKRELARTRMERDFLKKRQRSLPKSPSKISCDCP